MLTTIFIIALIILVISSILYITGMVQLAKKNPGGRGTMTVGFAMWLLAIIVTSVLFGFFS